MSAVIPQVRHTSLETGVNTKKTSSFVLVPLSEMCPGNPGNYSQFSPRRYSTSNLANKRSNSLDQHQMPLSAPASSSSTSSKQPVSSAADECNQNRRHSDSETHSCDSLPYALGTTTTTTAAAADSHISKSSNRPPQVNYLMRRKKLCTFRHPTTYS